MDLFSRTSVGFEVGGTAPISEREQNAMRAVISEHLRNTLRQHGKSVLTVTLHTVRCACETTFRVSVEADDPRDPDLYASFVQDGIQIYYSPRLDGTSDVLELDDARGLFQGKPVLAGPEELLATLIMGWVEAQNLTLGKERLDMQ